MLPTIDTGYRAQTYDVARDDSHTVVGIHLPGHDMSTEDALSAMLSIWPDEVYEVEEYDGVEFARSDELPRRGFETPRRVWARRVLIEEGDEDQPEEFWGGYLWAYDDGPERGGDPITLVEPDTGWIHRCAACGEKALTGCPWGGDYIQALEVDESELVHPLTSYDHIYLCREHSEIVTRFEKQQNSCCNLPCVDCGHAAGGHGRTKDGTCWGEAPFGANPVPCGCTGPGPLQMCLTLDDLRETALVPELTNTQTADEHPTPKHVCDTGDFDRTLCPEPCGTMHSYCSTCGALQDPCSLAEDVAAYLSYERPEGVAPLFDRVLHDARGY